MKRVKAGDQEGDSVFFRHKGVSLFQKFWDLVHPAGTNEGVLNIQLLVESDVDWFLQAEIDFQSFLVVGGDGDLLDSVVVELLLEYVYDVF